VGRMWLLEPLRQALLLFGSRVPFWMRSDGLGGATQANGEVGQREPPLAHSQKRVRTVGSSERVASLKRTLPSGSPAP
jgi:hypothetical protein